MTDVISNFTFCPPVAERSGSGGGANQFPGGRSPAPFTAHFFANSSKTGG